MTKPFQTIRKRSVFLAARDKGTSVKTAGFILQALETETGEVGYTVSKRVGNAVVRNRVKRRLRALVRELLPDRATPNMSYVFIGRKAALDRPYDKLKSDFKYAFHALNGDATS